MTTRRQAHQHLLGAAVVAAVPGAGGAQAFEAMALPPPRTDGGMPLMQALKRRRSTRAYRDTPLSLPVLSDLLWAAYGVNRPTGERTAPYWRHIMVIDVYVAMATGTWRYDPDAHRLLPHREGDLRARTGLQDFVGTAPLNLVYVAHGERMGELSAAEQRLYASVDAAFIGQNVYLFCASEGLASVFRGAVDTQALARALELPASQFVTFAQTVGHGQD
jgi:nitroreductase